MVVPSAANWFKRPFSDSFKFKDETKNSILECTKYLRLTKGTTNYKNVNSIAGRILRFSISI